MRRPRAGTLVLGTDRDSSKNYMPLATAIFDAVDLGKSEEPKVVHVTIVHDDWCAMLKGLGYCDCKPFAYQGLPEDLTV